jgi:hypothetical protein
VGKTFIVREAFIALGYARRYMPLPGAFFMGTFDPSTHDHTVFEEWDHEIFKYNYSQIKQLLDRESFPVDIKNRNARCLKVKCPVVFISNHSPFSDWAFVRRLNVIEALGNLENEKKVHVPKEEVDSSEIEVIEISSSMDDEDEENSRNEVAKVLENACEKAFPAKKVLSERNV